MSILAPAVNAAAIRITWLFSDALKEDWQRQKLRGPERTYTSITAEFFAEILFLHVIHVAGFPISTPEQINRYLERIQFDECLQFLEKIRIQDKRSDFVLGFGIRCAELLVDCREQLKSGREIDWAKIKETVAAGATAIQKGIMKGKNIHTMLEEEILNGRDLKAEAAVMDVLLMLQREKMTELIQGIRDNMQQNAAHLPADQKNADQKNAKQPRTFLERSADTVAKSA
jgi:hypothetical protein